MPRYRARQVLGWVHDRHCDSFADMTNLSRADRQMLADQAAISTGDIVADRLATDGTRKLLMQWRHADSPDSRLPVVLDAARQTECVLIPSDDRRTACISSQIGCPVGCRFCASGLGGLDGNLSAGRIVEQVWALGRATGERVSNVVFMGMGEPLANIGPVMQAVRILAAPWGGGISARRITISTVGLPSAIRRLAADLELPVTLALSLHAPTDDLRRELIPWAEYASIAEILDACRIYFAKTKREITLEYTLMHGVNDRPEQARELAKIARSLRSNINLIRYNEVDGLPYQRPLDDDVRRFQETLRAGGVNAHIRASRGRDIEAACGQLRHETSSA
jgi:23S rRNA (adenine2503-C2)-methyltransferase